MVHRRAATAKKLLDLVQLRLGDAVEQPQSESLRAGRIRSVEHRQRAGDLDPSGTQLWERRRPRVDELGVR